MLIRTTLALACLAGATQTTLAGSTQAPQRVEVAFVLDTTGSMADLIDGAKRKIWSIANTVVDNNPNADIAMALVAYRDRGDEYVVRTAPLSEDIQGLYGKLIRLQADGGDDTPESVNEALATAIGSLQWSKDPSVKRIVFLVGDAPPHMDYQGERQYPDILREAVQRGIVVNAVQAGDMPETTHIWQEIAQFGRGRYIAIPQSGGEVAVIVTPYDEEIIELQQELDGTVLPYGRAEMKEEVGRKMREKAAAPESVQIDNSKYYSKRAVKKEVITGGGDLLGDLRNDGVELDSIAEDELPSEVQAQPKAKRKLWLEQRSAARKALEDKMAGLIAKRDAFASEKRAKEKTAAAGDSFDRAVEDTLKTQLE